MSATFPDDSAVFQTVECIDDTELCSALLQSQAKAWLASVLGQPSVNTLFHLQPKLSPEISASVNGPHENLFR